MKKWLRYLIAIVLTAVTLYLSFRNLDWRTLLESLSRIHLFWVILAVVNSLLSVYLLGCRWQVLLRSNLDIKTLEIFKVTTLSQYVNILVPGRFGEIFKAWLVSRRHRCSGSYVLGTVVVDKIFDFFAMVILGILVPIFFVFKEKFKEYTFALVVCLLLVPLFILMIWKKEKIRQWIIWITRIFPKKFNLRQRVVNFFEKGIEAFELLKSAKTVIQLVLLTFFIILSMGLTNFFLFQAFNLKLSIWHALVLQLILIIGMAPPSVPGKIGIFEYAVIFAFSTFGIDKSLAFSYGLVLHVVGYLPKILLGLIFMATLKLSIKKAESELIDFRSEVK
jgi:uncharacterized protein (TIRG00374 family)